LPSFWAELTAREDVPALALRVVVLTATRSNETRQARWDEFDLDEKVWAIPAARMKSGREHRVPLIAAMCGLLYELRASHRGG
jgi:integrase